MAIAQGTHVAAVVQTLRSEEYFFGYLEMIIVINWQKDVIFAENSIINPLNPN